MGSENGTTDKIDYPAELINAVIPRLRNITDRLEQIGQYLLLTSAHRRRSHLEAAANTLKEARSALGDAIHIIERHSSGRSP